MSEFQQANVPVTELLPDLVLQESSAERWTTVWICPSLRNGLAFPEEIKTDDWGEKIQIDVDGKVVGPVIRCTDGHEKQQQPSRLLTWKSFISAQIPVIGPILVETQEFFAKGYNSQKPTSMTITVPGSREDISGAPYRSSPCVLIKITPTATLSEGSNHERGNSIPVRWWDFRNPLPG